MEISITIDWIAFTFKEETHESAAWLGFYANCPENVPETAHNGYSDAKRDGNGISSSWNVNRPEMGVHVIISGSALRMLCKDVGQSQQEILRSTLDAGASLTRLDLAKDAKGSSLSISQIYLNVEAKNYRGTARTFSYMKGHDGGQTIYIGSRQSEKFIRLYDKAAQMGEMGTHWYRLELECKGAQARALASYLCGGGDWQSGFDTMVRATIDMPENPHWQAFFPVGSVPVGFPKEEKLTDREKWILQQCLPAIVKHYVEHRYSKAVALLRETLDLIDRDGYPTEIE